MQGELKITPDTLVEQVYVAHDGEFLREGWVAQRYAQLPAKIVRPTLTVEQAARLYARPVEERQSALAELVEKEGVREVEYYPNKYFTVKRPAWNAEIVDDLLNYGFTLARRFPAVVFYVDELVRFTYPTSGKVLRCCRLTTNGDLEDLLRFAHNIGLDINKVQQAGGPLMHFELTPKRREKAVKAGAKETTQTEERDRQLREFQQWNPSLRRELPDTIN
jgi:hypothetical protein